MDNGYILLARSILDSDVFASQKLLKIWVWCLCKANYKDRSVPLKIGKGDTIVNVKRGSFIFGRNKAEEELFIDGSTIYKSMQKLELMNMIKIQSNNQYSVVTICKYNEYQQNENYKVTSKEQATNNQVTSNEQPSNNQVTSNEQPSNTTNTLPKDKQVNKETNKQLNNIEFDIFWNLYDKKVGTKDCKVKWIKLDFETQKKIINFIPSFLKSITDKKFQPHPKTFLNQERWNDEIVSVKKDNPHEYVSYLSEEDKQW